MCKLDCLPSAWHCLPPFPYCPPSPSPFPSYPLPLTFPFRPPQDTVFVSTEHSATGGMLGITRKGQVLHVGLNEANLVPYIMGQLRDQVPS